MKIYNKYTNKLLVLLFVIMLLSCGEKEIDEDKIEQPPTDSPEQVESMLTKYYLPTTDWGQSKSEVKKIMVDYSLLFEDTQCLIYGKDDPYIRIAYEFTSNKLCVAYRYVPENSDIVYRNEINKLHKNFIELPEYKFICYWDESSKTYMQPMYHKSTTTMYDVYMWLGTEYLE